MTKILSLFLLAGALLAQDKNVYVVTHVDVTPNFVNEGAGVLKAYGAASRKEPGAVRIDVLQQDSRPNHFTLVEVWKDQKAFDAHEGGANAKQFRSKIQPMLGSPFDERPHSSIQ